MTDTATDRAARQDIAELLVRYASGIDRRDWDLFRSCFTADCHCDYGDIGVWTDVEQITQFMIVSHEHMSHTMHRITNQAVDVSGDTATSRSYVDVLLTFGDGSSGINGQGFYDDELVHTVDGWRIARRRYTMVHLTTFGGLEL